MSNPLVIDCLLQDWQCRSIDESPAISWPPAFKIFFYSGDDGVNDDEGNVDDDDYANNGDDG